jgi:RNA polymerase sigma factor FliA
LQVMTPTQRLTPGQAEALWLAWSSKNDKSARDRLVLAYSPMVRYLASRKIRELPSHCELDDLVSYGLIALIEAIDRFDPNKGASFEQYAWTRVAGAIIDELRRQDWASRSVRRTGRTIERERDQFYAREGTVPTEEQLADSVSLTVDEMRSALLEVERADISSLNTTTRSGDEATSVEVIDTIKAPRGKHDPEFSLLGQERVRVVRKTIARLSERERDVLALIHVHELPGAAIGELLGVSESRVSQILSGVRAKLQEQLRLYDAESASAA